MPGPRGACIKIDEKAPRRHAATATFLERVFHKLMLNFTWWVNRKDAEGRNIFQGGFLGLDNIGVFDRSAPLPTGGHHRSGRRHQLDGDVLPQPAARSRWNWRSDRPSYEDVATKFLEHFLHIANAMNQPRRRRRTACGMKRTAFSTMCCILPDGQRHAAEDPLDGRSDSAVRRRNSGARTVWTGCPDSNGA